MLRSALIRPMALMNRYGAIARAGCVTRRGENYLARLGGGRLPEIVSGLLQSQAPSQ